MILRFFTGFINMFLFSYEQKDDCNENFFYDNLDQQVRPTPVRVNVTHFAYSAVFV